MLSREKEGTLQQREGKHCIVHVTATHYEAYEAMFINQRVKILVAFNVAVGDKFFSLSSHVHSNGRGILWFPFLKEA